MDRFAAMQIFVRTVELGSMSAAAVELNLSSQLAGRQVRALEGTAWQARPLDPMYPVVFFDALRVKIREDAVVHNKAVYRALRVLYDGTRDILGLWIESTEGAKFWMKVFNDLKTCDVDDT